MSSSACLSKGGGVRGKEGRLQFDKFRNLHISNFIISKEDWDKIGEKRVSVVTQSDYRNKIFDINFN